MGCSPSVPVEDEEVTEVYSAKPPTPNASSPEALVATTHCALVWIKMGFEKQVLSNCCLSSCLLLVPFHEKRERYKFIYSCCNFSLPESFIAVTWQEVERLRGIYDRISNRIHYDGLIHRDEFMWALFKAPKDNLFAERVCSYAEICLGFEGYECNFKTIAVS